METSGAVKRSIEGEDKAKHSRCKLTLLEEQKITHLAENKHQFPKLLIQTADDNFSQLPLLLTLQRPPLGGRLGLGLGLCLQLSIRNRASFRNRATP
jgi:hypothetical protein